MNINNYINKDLFEVTTHFEKGFNDDVSVTTVAINGYNIGLIYSIVPYSTDKGFRIKPSVRCRDGIGEQATKAIIEAEYISFDDAKAALFFIVDLPSARITPVTKYFAHHAEWTFDGVHHSIDCGVGLFKTVNGIEAMVSELIDGGALDLTSVADIIPAGDNYQIVWREDLNFHDDEHQWICVDLNHAATVITRTLGRCLERLSYTLDGRMADEIIKKVSRILQVISSKDTSVDPCEQTWRIDIDSISYASYNLSSFIEEGFETDDGSGRIFLNVTVSEGDTRRIMFGIDPTSDAFWGKAYHQDTVSGEFELLDDIGLVHALS